MKLILERRYLREAGLFSLSGSSPSSGFGYSFLNPSDTTTFLHLVSIYVRVMGWV
jgi:hypothetical protein